jgi:NAD(P)H-flavin reductase
MSRWYEAEVSAVNPAAEGLTSIELDLKGTPLAGTHQIPGQYVTLGMAGVGQGTFAIASAPDEGRNFEFLVKGGSPLTDALRGARPGTKVQISLPTGKGFPLDRAVGKNLLLFATGSGISAIRSVIEWVRGHRSDFGRVYLYFGARTPGAFAYEAELAQWEKTGIEVFRSVSQPGESGWKGLTGYIQNHLGELDVKNAVAFLSGQKSMVADVTRALRRRGVSPEDIHLNF